MTDASPNHADPASPAGSGGQTREQFLKRAGAGAAVLFAGSGFAGLGASARAARHGRNARAAVSGTVTVRYWGQGPERVAWANRIKYFSAKYPNVKVVSQLLQKNGYDEFPALLTQIAAGHAPDVMRVLNYQPTQLVAQGNALMPLDDFIKNDKTLDVPDFVPVAWAAGRWAASSSRFPRTASRTTSTTTRTPSRRPASRTRGRSTPPAPGTSSRSRQPRRRCRRRQASSSVRPGSRGTTTCSCSWAAGRSSTRS